MNEIKGERAGTIIVLYDRVKRGLIESITCEERLKNCEIIEELWRKKRNI